jgi:hypothetical protein
VSGWVKPNAATIGLCAVPPSSNHRLKSESRGILAFVNQTLASQGGRDFARGRPLIFPALLLNYRNRGRGRSTITNRALPVL